MLFWQGKKIHYNLTIRALYYLIFMKQKIKKVLTNVNKKLVATKDTLFQTKEQEVHNGLFSVIKKEFFSIPISIRITSLSLFLFMLWWGLGADTFFSLYIKSIVNNVVLVSLIGALLPFSKLLFSLPIGEMNEHGNMKQLLFMSKLLYIIAGFLFFFAGVFSSPLLLIIAVILNGFASATMFTTYETYIHLASHDHNTQSSRWLYFSSINAAYVIGALFSVFLIPRIGFHYLYLFIVVFGILSLFTDKKIPVYKAKHLKEIFAKESFMHQFIREVFSLSPLKRAYLAITWYPKSMIYALLFEILFNSMAYIWFLFIPLIAAKNNLGLGQIALIFALMRLPYVTNFFTNGWTEGYNKKLFVAIVILFLSFLFASFWFNESFGSILIISFGISIWLSMIRPVISSLISEQTHPQDAGTIAGVQQFVAMGWSIIGSIGFGVCSGIFGMQNTFIIIWITLFVLAIWWIGKKLQWKINHQ